jgi:hypothetical protein
MNVSRGSALGNLTGTCKFNDMHLRSFLNHAALKGLNFSLSFVMCKCSSILPVMSSYCFVLLVFLSSLEGLF